MSCLSSIRRWDSNPQPLEHESSPITTRPGLPPHFNVTFGLSPIAYQGMIPPSKKRRNFSVENWKVLTTWYKMNICRRERDSLSLFLTHCLSLSLSLPHSLSLSLSSSLTVLPAHMFTLSNAHVDSLSYSRTMLSSRFLAQTVSFPSLYVVHPL